VVEMGEEDVRDLYRLHARLQHAVVGARPEVEEDLPVAGLDEIARTHALQRGRGRSGAEESYPHGSSLLFSTEITENTESALQDAMTFSVASVSSVAERSKAWGGWRAQP